MNYKIFILAFLFSSPLFSQEASVKGKVIDSDTQNPIADVQVKLENTSFKTETSTNGTFLFTTDNLELGEQVLILQIEDYQTKKFPIVIEEGKTLDLGQLKLSLDRRQEDKEISLISLSDNELDGGDNSVSFNISGLLQSSKDVFSKAAAYDFSSTFFSIRGLDNQYGKVLINGVEMNKQFNGRPSWSNWGGLNDVQRNREFSRNFKASDNTFGGFLGSTNINMRASKMRKGGRVSYASSNRSYTGRFMGSYNSGKLKGDWYFSVLVSRRYGDEGYTDGTLYDANSLSIMVEKKINDNHSLNLTSFYTPNRRGLSEPLTAEAVRLRDNKYNPNWGYQNGEKRNSQIREIEQPVFMLNHYWKIKDGINLNTNASFSGGKFSTTRINNGGTRIVEGPNGQPSFIGGARNPSPIYYQNFPSYHLRFSNPRPVDFQNAYLAEQEFINDGQFDWTKIYETNLNNLRTGGNSTYILSANRTDDRRLQFNTILDAQLNENITLNGKIRYRNLYSENYAEVKDLLGGQQFLDVDFFADENPNAVGETQSTQELAQSDLRNPNRTVTEGERFSYNYEIDSEVYESFAQLQFKYKKFDFYVAGTAGRTTYQRTGLYENGFFPGDLSFGPGEKLEFNTFGGKLGGVYKLTGRHLFEINAAYTEDAPTLRNSYSNARQNNEIVENLTEVKSQAFDASYLFKSPDVDLRLSAFYAGFQDQTNVQFYFTEDITGVEVNDGNAFVQEVMSGIDTQHIGAELGIEYQVTSTIKLKGAASYGEYTYANNPDLYLTSQDFQPGQKVRFGDGKTALEDFRLSNGPQQAYQIGFEYRDPKFWFVGVTSNFFYDNFVGASGLVRSDNFALDQDGIPFDNYDEDTEDLAREILKQENMGDYMLMNAIGGKSWKVGEYYIGFFAVVNNILDEVFRSGGFEQSRRANFQNRGADLLGRENGPLFGNRYFYGRGTTYYMNFYIRF